eukprot:1160727-Pelagomonas_calceolata.AAC.27
MSILCVFLRGSDKGKGKSRGYIVVVAYKGSLQDPQPRVCRSCGNTKVAMGSRPLRLAVALLD